MPRSQPDQRQRRCSPWAGLGNDHRGIIGILFAMMLLPILGFMGLAVDYGFMMRAKTHLDAAADSAVLAASKAAANAFAADPQSNYITAGGNIGQQWFVAQASSLNGVTITNTSIIVQQGTHPDGTQDTSSTSFTAKMTYTATMQTYFASIFNFNVANLQSAAQANIILNPYTNFYFMLDNSPSMGIAASATDIDNMIAAVQWVDYNDGNWANANDGGIIGQDQDSHNHTQCAFACHDHTDTSLETNHLTLAQHVVSNDYLGVARLYNIPLRIDVLSQAAGTALNDIATAAGSNLNPPQYQLGVFTFNDQLNQIFPTSTTTHLSSNIASAQTLLAKNGTVTSGTNTTDYAGGNPIDLQTTGFGCNGFENTNFGNALVGPPPNAACGAAASYLDMNDTIGSVMSTTCQNAGVGSPAAGDMDGTTPCRAHQVLFIVSDGSEDETGENPRGIPFNSTWCQTLKNRGITIYALWTQYTPLYNGTWFSGTYNGIFGSSNDFYNATGVSTTPSNDNGAPVAPAPDNNLQNGLKSCATSPATFFSASDTASITVAMQEMVDAALGVSAHLVPATLNLNPSGTPPAPNSSSVSGTNSGSNSGSSTNSSSNSISGLNSASNSGSSSSTNSASTSNSGTNSSSTSNSGTNSSSTSNSGTNSSSTSNSGTNSSSTSNSGSSSNSGA